MKAFFNSYYSSSTFYHHNDKTGSVEENTKSRSGKLNLPVINENKTIPDINTNHKENDMDEGIESILENISQQGVVSISDAKDSGLLIFLKVLLF